MKRAALLLFLLAPIAAQAAFSKASRGTTAVPFLTLGAGARAAAMGGAQTAGAEGGFAMAWNPAGLAVNRAWSLDVMHADWLQSAGYNVAAAAVPVGADSAVGLGFQQYLVDDIERRDNAGFQDGSFKPQDLSAALGWATHMADDGVTWGVSAKYIQSKIEDSAVTGALDVGLITDEQKGHRFGLAMQNLGGRLKYETGGDPLPFLVSAGATQRFGHTLLAGDLKFPRDNNPYAALGVEQALVIGGGWQGCARAGYSTRPGTESGGTTGLSFGAGLSAPWFSLDYAFAPFGDLGSVHLFSLSVRTGRSSQQP